MIVAFDQDDRRARLASALAVAIVHILIGCALIFGLNPHYRRTAASALKIFDVPPAPPPPPPQPIAKPARKGGDEGAAAPPALKARPAPVVAPPPIVRLPIPPPITAAPVAGPADQPRSGAAPAPGPGTGGGGAGNGTGTGNGGDGDGGGEAAVHARLVRGRIRNSDYPDGAWKARIGGVVLVEYIVETNGRARDCRVVRSSGRSDLDTTTCRLIESRYRYEPAKDRTGRPIAEVQGWEQTWWLERGD